MCITKNKPKISRKDKVVFKVFKKGPTFLFYLYSGGIAEPIHKKSIKHKFNLSDYDNLSTGFDLGYGYHCFKKKSIAKRYIHKYIYFMDIIKDLGKYVIIPMIIPKGTRYATGKILRNHIGEGLLSMRAERLRYEEEN